MANTNNDLVEVSSGLGSTERLDANEGVVAKKHSRRKHRFGSQKMEKVTTVAEVHRSSIPEKTQSSAGPARVHSSGRRNRSKNRHDYHKCHKNKSHSGEHGILDQVSHLINENNALNRRLNASMSSLDSGLPTTDNLPPIDIDLRKAYQHIQHENTQLLEDIRRISLELRKLKNSSEKDSKEKICLLEDVNMLKNLVYRLNAELEKFQDLRAKTRDEKGKSNKYMYELPNYYHKNFLKPILPLLNAYSETISEKNEVIEQLETNFDRFHSSFNELLKENETLYKELEKKLSNNDENVIEQLSQLREELKLCQEEKELFKSQTKLECDKLKEVQTVFKTKVSLLERERDSALEKVQEVQVDLYTLRGKYSVLKQELDRLRAEDDTKVPMAVHSASISECKRLFQNLKNEQNSQMEDLQHKLKDCKAKLARREEDEKRELEEKLVLEQGNFDLAFECESMKRKIADLEAQIADPTVQIVQHSPDENAQDVKLQLRETLKRNADLEKRLLKTKKRLQQSMTFAEDLVREQEALLAQLHEKQRENSAMVTQFGSLKKKLKNVEKGAQMGLNSVEERMQFLEQENNQLLNEVERLNQVIRERSVPDPPSTPIDTGDTSS